MLGLFYILPTPHIHTKGFINLNSYQEQEYPLPHPCQNPAQAYLSDTPVWFHCNKVSITIKQVTDLFVSQCIQKLFLHYSVVYMLAIALCLNNVDTLIKKHC